MTPIVGAIIDYYLDPIAESILRPTQSADQVGITSGMSYLLAALQRGECQRWAIDQKLTCFGVSLDGEDAFPSVEREIQIRELYSVGYTVNTLTTTQSVISRTETPLLGELLKKRKIPRAT